MCFNLLKTGVVQRLYQDIRPSLFTLLVGDSRTSYNLVPIVLSRSLITNVSGTVIVLATQGLKWGMKSIRKTPRRQKVKMEALVSKRLEKGVPKFMKEVYSKIYKRRINFVKKT